MVDFLLASSAQNIFWLARYVERAENLARILDVNGTFARDRTGGHDWLPVLLINMDEQRFHAAHGTVSADAVLRFYVTDRENPTSIVSAIHYARENARALRPIIPLEMWSHLNVFHNRLLAVDEGSFAPGNLARLLGWVRESCQAHLGIADGTLYRDQAWYFYEMGRLLERADQTTRLLDIKYHLLLPSAADVGSPIDISQWNVLLRSAAGYHAYRRIQHGGITPAGVAGLLLLDRCFPRSVALCVAEAERRLAELASHHGLALADGPGVGLGKLSAALGSTTIEAILAQGLHDFLDLVQRDLITITDHRSAAYFAPSQASEQQQEQNALPNDGQDRQ